MHVILVRHGIAVEPAEWSGTEAERPLTKEGRSKTHQAAKGLKALDLQPTHLLSSPFVRAKETAVILQDTLDCDLAITEYRELVYDHPPTIFLSILKTYPRDANVMCVGHEPHLGQTAALLLSGHGLPGCSLKKAGACGFEFDGHAEVGQGWLKWWLPPALLRRLGSA